MKFTELIQSIYDTHDYLQNKAISAVNQSLTIRNWLIGLYIVEYEQNGEDRAKYGAKLIPSIAQELKERKVKGLAFRNLNYCRLFYQVYPRIIEVLDRQSLPEPIMQSVTAKSLFFDKTAITGVSSEQLISRLSFTHIVELIQQENELKRAFYEIQAIKGNWSVRELKRQMGSLLYERTGLSRDKEKLIEITNDKATPLVPQDVIRDPYIFEFLGLPGQKVLKEQEVESALLDHLQQFLLELGKGFCFEARQKRITLDNEHYYVDLVFYHRILKCHVLIELKTRKFNHLDAGQMNFYLNYFKHEEMSENDNPPIGILLCTDKESSIVQYATGGIDNQLFVSKYQVVLPTEEELKAFIESESH